MIRIALLSLALLPLAAAGQMYKWVDEKGRTVYSEQPPPDGKGNKVDIKPAPASPAQAAQGATGREQQPIPRPTGPAQNWERRSTCVESQAMVQALYNSKSGFKVNEKGEKVYYDQAALQREIDGWTANVKKYC
jgi:hypothetical protein